MSSVKIEDTLEEGFTKRNYKGGSPLHELISCYSYSSHGNYFHTEDGRFARIWKLPIHDMSSLPEEAYYGYSNALSNVLSSWPSNQTGQIIRIANTDVREKLSNYANDLVDEADEFSRALVESVVDQQINASNNHDGFFQTVSSRDIKKAEHDILKSIESADLRKATSINIKTEMSEGCRPFHYELYMVLMFKSELSRTRLFVDKSKARLASLGLGSVDANQLAMKHYNDNLDEFMNAVNEIQQAMMSVNIPVEILTGQGATDLLYSLFNPARKQTIGSPLFRESDTIPTCLVDEPHDQHDTINRSVGFSSVRRTKKGWKITYNDTDYFYRASSLIQRPDQSFPGILQQVLGHDQLDNIITINFQVTSSANTFWRLKVKDQMLGTKERLGLGDEKVRLQQRTDLEAVKSLVSPENMTDRQSMIDASVHIINISLDEKTAEATAMQQERLFQNRGHFESERADAVIHQAIPCNFRQEVHDFIDRSVPYLSENLADMVPMYSAYQGITEPKILVNNRSGSPVFVDLWNSNVITGHGLIAGTTGTGKSFTFNNFLMACIAKYQPKIWIVDKGRSYQTLCSVVNGNYIELVTEETFDERTGLTIKPTCINPFYTPMLKGIRKRPSKEELEFLTKLLTGMILSSSKMGATDVGIKASWINLLYDSLITFFKDNTEAPGCDKELTFSDYIPHLKNMNASSVTGKEIAEALSMYYGDGPYAALFDGILDIDWDNDFTVLETERMATSPCLGVVLLALFRQIDLYSKFKLPKNRPKLIAVDEAWSTLSDPNAANALGAFFRELRKYKGACLLISQGLVDYIRLVESEGAGAEDGILANTSHYFLLACGDADYTAAVDTMKFTPSEVTEWKSLASLPPYFGEVFYRMKTKRNTFYAGVFRMWPTPIQRWVATTDPDDAALRETVEKQLQAQGLTINESRLKSVLQLAKEKPFGANYGNAA